MLTGASACIHMQVQTVDADVILTISWVHFVRQTSVRIVLAMVYKDNVVMKILRLCMYCWYTEMIFIMIHVHWSCCFFVNLLSA